jgi:hypothetical protein
MSPAVWRWLVAVLLIANCVALVLFLRGNGRADAPESTLPPLPTEWPRLVLAGEAVSGTVNSGQTRRCFSIGPLPSLLAQQRAEDRLRPVSSQVRTRQTVSDRDRGWWVYLPAGSRTQALDLTRQLAERGLEDFYVVTRGQMENVVSVGLFERVDNARARQRQVLDAGFSAQMEIRRESTPQFWVEYQADPGLEAPWRFIIEASPGAQHRAIPCFGDAGVPR